MSPAGPDGLPAGQALVCVYYKAAPALVPAVIARVREIQRILRLEPGLEVADVLLRSPLPCRPDPALQPPASAEPAGVAAAAALTLMETYQLAAPGVPALLARLDALTAPLLPQLAGPRHLELFEPCAW